VRSEPAELAGAGRIVGWQASRSLKTDLALHALDQAIWDRNRAVIVVDCWSAAESSRSLCDRRRTRLILASGRLPERLKFLPPDAEWTQPTSSTIE
jgi:hypothetical protein